tara:strand:- start:5391 stop:5888 length:498 start_codon:yes stop_codon:yes gene_type:complete
MKSLAPALSFLVFLLASLSVDAQQYLYLKKKGELPAYRWSQGDLLELKVRNGDEEYWLSGDFVRADSNRIVFGTKIVRHENIVALKVKRGLMPFFGKAAMAGATLFPGVIIFNAIINGDRPIIRPLTVYLSLGVFATGYALHHFGTKRFYFKDGWYLEHIDFNQE